MSVRWEDIGEGAVVRALETLRTAAYVLRDFDFTALDELDPQAIAEWEAALSEARATLARALVRRGGEELEAPPRGQLERYEISRVKHHVQGISKALLSDLERVDALAGAEIGKAVLLGLLYSARSVEQFARWLDPEETRERLRARVLEPRRKEPEPEPEPQAPPPSTPPVEELPQAARAAPEPPAPEHVAKEPVPEPEPELDYPATIDLDAVEPSATSEPVGEGSIDDLASWFEGSSAPLEEWALPEPSAPASLPSPEPPPPLPQPASAFAPPAPPPPGPARYDVDLSSYYERPDEYGGAFRSAPLAIHHGCSRGPELAKRERCLDATTVRATSGGAAFAIADGSDASLGSWIASVVATKTFCERLAALKEEPKDPKAAIVAAAEAARRQLESTLRSLVESADDSDAFRRFRGSLPADSVRRILEHTLEPVAGLKHVTPAFAVSFAGGLVVRREEEDAYELTLLSIGTSIAERKARGQFTEAWLAPGPAPARLVPGRLGTRDLASLPFVGPTPLKPGDVVLVGSSALRRGYEGPALEKLPLLSPELLQLGSPDDDHALQVLRQMSAAADRFDALEERRGRTSRQPLFADDLAAVLITVAARARTQTVPQLDEPAAKEPGSSARRAAVSTIAKLLKKPL